MRKIAIVSMALVVMVGSSLVASTGEAAPADNRVSWAAFSDMRACDNQDVTKVVTVPFNILVHNVSAIVEMTPLEPTATFAQARIVVTRSDGYLLHQFHVDRYRDPAGLSDIFRKDPIAPYNHGNIRLTQAAYDQAVLAYRQALARDPQLGEARYNLAQALEAAGKTDAAAAELDVLLQAEPSHADAVFNLAQLRMKAGDVGAAKALFERYLTLEPPESWAETARRAILYCAAGGRG